MKPHLVNSGSKQNTKSYWHLGSQAKQVFTSDKWIIMLCLSILN